MQCKPRTVRLLGDVPHLGRARGQGGVVERQQQVRFAGVALPAQGGGREGFAAFRHCPEAGMCLHVPLLSAAPTPPTHLPDRPRS